MKKVGKFSNSLHLQSTTSHLISIIFPTLQKMILLTLLLQVFDEVLCFSLAAESPKTVMTMHLDLFE